MPSLPALGTKPWKDQLETWLLAAHNADGSNKSDTAKADVASAVMDGDAAGGVLSGTFPSPGLAASVAGNGIGVSANVLSVNVDGVTLEIVGDSLQIKAGGVTAAKVAADVATQAELDAHTGQAAGAHAATAISSTATGDVAATTVQAAIAELAAEKQAISAKGAVNGYASLDASGLVPTAQLPAMNYVPLDGVIVAATRILTNKLLAGDAQPAFRILGSGRHEWGPGGATAPDVYMYRAGNQTVEVAPWFRVNDPVTGSTVLVGGSTNWPYIVNQVGAGAGGAGIAMYSTLARNTISDWEIYTQSGLDGLQFYSDEAAAVTSRLTRSGLILDLLNAGQKLIFGSAGDTNVYRRAADVLGTDDAIYAKGGIVSMEAAAQQIALWTDGRLYFGTALDTSLYRAAADLLATDDGFLVALGIFSYRPTGTPTAAIFSGGLNSDTVDRFRILGNGTMEWGSGSVTRDTTLYRSGASALKTDGTFEAVGRVLPASLGSGTRDGTKFLRDDGTWQVAGADLVYNGDYPANTPYTDGDIVIYNNVAYMCVRPTSAAPVPTDWPLLPSVVNGQFLKGVSGAPAWAALTAPDIPGLVTADTGWTNLTLTGGAAHYSAPYGPGQYRKLANGMVQMQGLITSGGPSVTIATLPVGYRPASGRTLIFGGAMSGTFTADMLRLDGSGILQIQGVSAGNWVSLTCVSYFAEG